MLIWDYVLAMFIAWIDFMWEFDVACVLHFVACVMLVMFCWLCLLVLSVSQAVHGFSFYGLAWLCFLICFMVGSWRRACRFLIFNFVGARVYSLCILCYSCNCPRFRCCFLKSSVLMGCALIFVW